MAADPITDDAIARRLLERATAADTTPELTTQEVDDLMARAASDDDGSTVYTGAALNRAASTGWTWKAGKVSADFSLRLEDGVTFNRDEMFQHCLRMAADYLLGTASVIGTPRRNTGIVSVPLVSDIGEVS